MASMIGEPAAALRHPCAPADLNFLAGGGEMGARMRALDWSSTPLGPPAAWPQSLKTIVRVMLDSRYAMWMLWGPERTFFCNDAYLPTLGIKRDWALGARSDEVWEEIWPEIGPRIAQVLEHGRATWDEALLLFLERRGFSEETYHTFSYSPVYDDESRIAGMLCVVTEVTERVIGERRLRILRDLAASAVGVTSVEDTCRRALEVLENYPFSIPFAAIYLLGPESRRARRVAHTRGLPERVAPPALDESSGQWPIAALLSTEATQQVTELPAAGINVPAAPWPDLVQHSFLLPLKGSGGERLVGFLIAAASPRGVLDDSYRAFFDLVAGQITAAIADAQALEAERRRARALAEIDRAKTAFFSNVSHEFRTPLTLMLGPMEEVASDPQTPERVRKQIELAHRNSQRLLKLVNSLLDFSRIEAGRVQASYESTDLAALTRDLASTFRSAMERAGLQFTVECHDLGQPVYVDREMWEKIVLNLLSNAFKFTLEGKVAVRLQRDEQHAVLEVSDTGVGVPEHELPRLFERFYRVEGTAARTQEGSGIGLALVHELVKLHGGTIDAKSELARGTTLRVKVPFGVEHLPRDRIKAPRALASTAMGAQVFVQEALRWIPSDGLEGYRPMPALTDNPPAAPDRRLAHTAGARILLADDNADMRAYVRDLLAPTYRIEMATDGEEALEAARRERPDLILSDIMMPRLDGLGLLKALRASEALRDVPVILLSARAGEEARLEGLDSGADDYLVKPFSARELLARVGALLELTRIRRQDEERLRLALSSIQDQFYMLDREWRYTVVNPRVPEMTGLAEAELLGRSIFELFPDLRGTFFEAELRAVVARLEPRRFEFEYAQRSFEIVVSPAGEGVAVLVSDITERKRTEQRLRESEERLRAFVNATSDVIYQMSADWSELRHLEGRAFIVDTQNPSRNWLDTYVEADEQSRVMAAVREAIRSKSIFQLEHRVRRVDGTVGWVLSRALPLKNPKGEIIEWFGAASDVTERKNTEQALREREEQLRLATEAAEVGLWDVDLITDTLYWPARVKAMFGISEDVPVSMADFYSGLHPEDRQRTSDAFAAALDPARRALYDVEYRTVGKEDGLIRWVAAKGRGIFDDTGRCVRVIGTAIDITVRKRAEEQLREQNRVQELLRNVSQALVAAQLDLERVVQIALDAATELSGAAFGAFFYNVRDERGERSTPYALSGAPREAFARFPKPRDTAVFGPTFRGEEIVRSFDITADPRYGQNAPHRGMPAGHLPVRSYLAVPVKAASGEVLGGLFFGHPKPGVFDDGAERLVLAVAAQAAVAFDNASLHRGLQREIEQRKRVEEALDEANRRKDEFLAMLAHELRNPLAPIGNASELLSRTVPDDTRAQTAVGMIKRQVTQLTRLVDDLLDVSRITQGRIQLKQQPIDLAAVITQAVETVEPQLRERRHKLSVTASSYEPLFVRGDFARLVQCVGNILTNAAKYSEPEGQITVRTGNQGAVAFVEISDTGVGIPPELLPRIFDLFVQSERTLDRSQGGLGIGLALVKRLVEMHGGEVCARSQGIGRGSTFEIRLPRIARPGSAAAEAASVRMQGRRILIVDDNADAADSLAMLLAFQGHETQVCYSGKEALACAEEFKPELGLLDIGLPEMNGYDLAKRLRMSSQLNGLYLIALTGYGQVEDQQRALAAGFDEHLIKPLDMAALERALAALATRERKAVRTAFDA